jgi:cytochrome c oxidase subunit 2
LTFETLEGRLTGTIDSLLPLGHYDLKWWNEWWLRKVIAGKVVEALHVGVNLSGHADRFPGVQFDSYMLNEDELAAPGDYRLLEVDEPIVLPTNTHIRLLITADDVIHSFAVPQLGVKVDAVPGRLNQQGVFIKRRGSFYGQCSELCGVNHGFMPIVIKAVSMKEFVHWYLNKFDSLYPEYGMKLANKEEVSAFLKTGAYPASFVDLFPQDRLTVPELLVGDKTDSVFNLPHSTSLAMNTMLGFIVDRFLHAHPGVLELNWGLVQLDSTTPQLPFSPLEGVLSPLGKGIKGPLLDWTNPAIYKRVVISDPARFVKETNFLPSLWTLKAIKQISTSGSVEPLQAVKISS